MPNFKCGAIMGEWWWASPRAAVRSNVSGVTLRAAARLAMVGCGGSGGISTYRLDSSFCLRVECTAGIGGGLKVNVPHLNCSNLVQMSELFAICG